MRVFLLTLNKDSDLFGASSEQNKDPSFLSYLFVSNKVVARSVSETANKSSIYDSFCLRKYALLRINVTCFQTRVDHTHPSFFWQCEKRNNHKNWHFMCPYVFINKLCVVLSVIYISICHFYISAKTTGEPANSRFIFIL